jgi:23S rRNA-/tRNA-specific pseudouridylate synthase
VTGLQIFREGPMPPEWEGRRLQQVVPEVFPGVLPSKKACRKALDQGWIWVILPREGREFQGQTATHTRPGSYLELRKPSSSPVRWADVGGLAAAQGVEVGWEDDGCAVVWKPAGMATHGPAARNLSALLPLLLQPSTQPDALAQPRPVHRLDRGTSGWLAIAKTHRAAIDLQDQWARRRVTKKYLGLAEGEVKAPLDIRLPLDGLEAHTQVIPLAPWIPSGPTPRGTWVELHPITGRTHQLRRHLAAVGHPLVGDLPYGSTWKRGSGLYLSCIELGFMAPDREEFLTFRHSPPRKFLRGRSSFSS